MLLIQSPSNTKNSGFTIVELVVVILILGILSVSVGPRFFGTISYKNREAKDALLSALRYSQQLAMNQGGDIRFVLTANNFTVERSTTTVLSPIKKPSGNNNEDERLACNFRYPNPIHQNFPCYIKIFDGVSASPPSIIIYDALGQPLATSGVPLTTNTSLSVGNSTIMVEAITGYAHEI